MSFLSSVLAGPINWILPSRCPLCGIGVADDHQFCLDCWHELDFIVEPWCASCSTPFAFDQAIGTKCTKCLEFEPSHDGVRAVVAYDSNSGKIAMGLKYSTKLGLADLIAKHLGKFLDEFEQDALLIPVPLHRKRLWERGFNQSVLIARSLARSSGLELRTDLLMRKQSTPPLRSMSAEQRHRIVKNAIGLGKKAKGQISGKTVLLVDDVYTTGSTANSCAKVLKSVGAETVIVLCWARVISEAERV